MRLIDADKLTKPTWAEDGASPDKRDGYNLGLYKMWQEVQNAPTVEPKQGEWVHNNDIPTYMPSRDPNRMIEILYYDCSACGESISDRYGKFPYCPHCGAKMVNWD